MGAERAVVASGWRYRRHLRSSWHPVVLVGVLAAAVAAGVVAAVLALPVLLDGDEVGPAEPTDVARGLALVLGVPWMAVGAVAVPLLVRALPDLVARRTIEGRAVRVRRPDRHRSAASDPADRRDEVLLAVDDGGTGELVAHPLGRARPGRPSRTAFDRVAAGDHVRVTVTPGYGYVVRVEVLADRHGTPVPPGPPTAAPPGCPVTLEALGAAYATTVRHVTAEPSPHGVGTWAFVLVGDDDLTVRLHATTAGEDGLAALLDAVSATAPRPWRRTYADPQFTSYDTSTGPLLVAHSHATAVALHHRPSSPRTPPASTPRRPSSTPPTPTSPAHAEPCSSRRRPARNGSCAKTSAGHLTDTSGCCVKKGPWRSACERASSTEGRHMRTDARDVRLATLGDIPIVHRLDALAFPSDAPDTRPAATGELESGVEARDVWLLEVGGVPTGYLHLDRSIAGQLYIRGLGVRPGAQGCGHGSYLLDRLLLTHGTNAGASTPVVTVTSPRNHRTLRMLFARSFAVRWVFPDFFGPSLHRLGLQRHGNEAPSIEAVSTIRVGDLSVIARWLDGGYVAHTLGDGGPEAPTFDIAPAASFAFPACRPPRAYYENPA